MSGKNTSVKRINKLHKGAPRIENNIIVAPVVMPEANDTMLFADLANKVRMEIIKENKAKAAGRAVFAEAAAKANAKVADGNVFATAAAKTDEAAAAKAAAAEINENAKIVALAFASMVHEMKPQIEEAVQVAAEVKVAAEVEAKVAAEAKIVKEAAQLVDSYFTNESNTSVVSLKDVRAALAIVVDAYLTNAKDLDANDINTKRLRKFADSKASLAFDSKPVLAQVYGAYVAAVESAEEAADELRMAQVSKFLNSAPKPAAAAKVAAEAEAAAAKAAAEAKVAAEAKEAEAKDANRIVKYGVSRNDLTKALANRAAKAEAKVAAEVKAAEAKAAEAKAAAAAAAAAAAKAVVYFDATGKRVSMTQEAYDAMIAEPVQALKATTSRPFYRHPAFVGVSAVVAVAVLAIAAFGVAYAAGYVSSFSFFTQLSFNAIVTACSLAVAAGLVASVLTAIANNAKAAKSAVEMIDMGSSTEIVKNGQMMSGRDNTAPVNQYKVVDSYSDKFTEYNPTLNNENLPAATKALFVSGQYSPVVSYEQPEKRDGAAFKVDAASNDKKVSNVYKS